jgi:hypothetical protein
MLKRGLSGSSGPSADVHWNSGRDQCDSYGNALPRLGTMSVAVKACTTSPRWLRVSALMATVPRSGRDRDGFTSVTSP